MATKILSLDGLNDSKLCDLTAQLLETISGVNSAKFEFISQKLTLQLDDNKDQKKVIAEVVSTLERTIPGVSISRKETGAADEARKAGSRYEDTGYGGGYRPRTEAAEEKKKKTIRLNLSNDTVIFSAGWVLALLVFAASFVIPAVSRLLCGASLALGTLIALAFRWNRNRAGYIVTTLASAAVAVTAFVYGENRQAAALMLLYLAGVIAGTVVREQYEGAARRVLAIRPKAVVRQRAGEIKQVAPEDVSAADRLLLRTGDTIPFDGIVAEGDAQIDASLLTGKTEPVRVRAGGIVRCGDRVAKGPVTIEVSATQDKSVIYPVYQALTENPARTQFISKMQVLSLFWTLLLLGVSGFAAFFFYVEDQEVWVWLYPTLSILLLATPCGVIGCAGTVIRGGVARALKDGVLVGSAASLDGLERIRTVATGNTGAVTEGDVLIAEIRPADGVDAGEVIEAAAAAEYGSAHPIAKAVLEYYEDFAKKKLENPRNGETVPGYGVRTAYDRRLIMVGSARYMREAGIDIPENTTGRPCVYVSQRGQYIGMLLLDDPLRPGAERFTQGLHSSGVPKTALISGCDTDIGVSLQEQMGFDELFCEKTKAEKISVLYSLIQREQGAVLYAGSVDEPEMLGAPCHSVLMGVDSMGPMLTAANAVIPSGDLGGISKLVQIGKGVRGILLANLAGCMAVKAALIACAFYVGLPLFVAPLANAVLSMLVELNASRDIFYGADAKDKAKS